MICKKKLSLPKKIMLLILTGFLAAPFFAQESKELQDSQDSLNYNVSVNVMVAPLFAVDAGGNPVYDLKEEELRLFVNNQPTEISAFKRIEFSHEQKVAEKIAGHENTEIVQPIGDRFVFVILDTMFNSLTGFRRSKEIAVKLIKEGEPGDNFVILENNPIGGLKYIGGPEKDGNVLIKKIDDICAPPEKWSRDIFSSRILTENVEVDPMTDPRLESTKWKPLRDSLINSEKLRYQHQVMYFSHVLSQFKYALKTIDKPKIVFLISEGIATGAFRAAIGSSNSSNSDETTGSGASSKGFDSLLTKDESTVFDHNKIYSAFMLRYLVDVVKSINSGGSVLYTINPRRTDDLNDDEASGEMSLRYLAGDSGGKYFAGSKPEKIVKRVKKTTAAYYELFYALLPNMGADMALRVECKRKDVRVHSLIHTERNRPYLDMEPVQKKIFALNVVTNGNWSRIVGRVMKAKFKKTGSTKDNLMTIQVPLPNVMQNRKIDMFSIGMDPKTQETSVNLVGSQATDVVNLKIKNKKEVNQFFVIIEPTTPYCIYNQI
ncbi:MAG: hypothetical protein NT166_20405 [Candidatus Aminicenantes bacterium]|nr:hypothetical protein [Candidatus Aminicenantes bacterium]